MTTLYCVNDYHSDRVYLWEQEARRMVLEWDYTHESLAEFYVRASHYTQEEEVSVEGHPVFDSFPQPGRGWERITIMSHVPKRRAFNEEPQFNVSTRQSLYYVHQSKERFLEIEYLQGKQDFSVFRYFRDGSEHRCVWKSDESSTISFVQTFLEEERIRGWLGRS